jgi:hypothetical protein
MDTNISLMFVSTTTLSKGHRDISFPGIGRIFVPGGTETLTS